MKNRKTMLKTAGLTASLLLINSVGMAKEDVINGGAPVGGAITAGTATYTINNYTNTGGMSTNMTITDGATGDGLFESGLFFRVVGDAEEFSMGVPDTESFIGDTAVMVWNNVGGRNLFSAEYMVVVGQPAAGEGTLTKSLVIHNLSGASLDLEIFNYEDFDVAGSFAANVGTLTNDPDFITITEGPDTTEWRAGTNTAYQVTPYQDLRVALATDGAVTDLDNSGLPFAGGDFTGGFQWSVSMPVFGIFTTESTSGFNSAAPVPADAILIDDVIWRDGFDGPAFPPIN